MSDTIDDHSTSLGLEPAAPAIVMVAAGHRAVTRVFAAEGGAVTTIGRALADGDPRVSERHATLRWERGGWTIEDLASHNGTSVDGRRITGAVRMVAADVVVRTGHTVCVLLRDGRGHPAPAGSGGAILGPEIRRAYDTIRASAATDTLLVHGESGAGKELAARHYHDAGPRRGGPFVAINCAAIPEGVAERLLFGARRGAFSGAVDAEGHFQKAHGGTLFLDEIADLDPSVQAKLLRVLETREVVPVGATSGIAIDAGIVAASHRELRSAVAARRFRDDLYYRIARTTVHLPPLRERKVDLARLVQQEVAAAGVAGLVAHAKLVEACLLRRWPGNIRELRAAVRQAAVAAIQAGRTSVRAEDLAAHAGRAFDDDERATEPAVPAAIAAAAIARAPDALPAPMRPAESLDRAAIEDALAKANGVVSLAARALGLHRTQLYRRMAQLGIDRT